MKIRQKKCIFILKFCQKTKIFIEIVGNPSDNSEKFRNFKIEAGQAVRYNFINGTGKINRKEFISMKTINTVETAKGKLLYTLFSEEAADGNSERYGITAVSRIFGDEETATVHDITSDFDFAERLVHLLADNLVLPSTFPEIVEEYIAAEFTVK